MSNNIQTINEWKVVRSEPGYKKLILEGRGNVICLINGAGKGRGSVGIQIFDHRNGKSRIKNKPILCNSVAELRLALKKLHLPPIRGDKKMIKNIKRNYPNTNYKKTWGKNGVRKR